MGQCQFIPTSFLAYAADGDGDSRMDIWTNKADVFALDLQLPQACRLEARPVVGQEVPAGTGAGQGQTHRAAWPVRAVRPS